MAAPHVQAAALERRRALHRASKPNTVKGTLYKSNMSGERQFLTLPPLPPGVLGQQHLGPWPPTPRFHTQTWPVSLSSAQGQVSPRAKRVRERRFVHAPAPADSDGTGVASSGAFCHFPALTQARASQTAEQLQVRFGVDETCAEGAHSSDNVQDAGVLAGSSVADLHAGIREPPFGVSELISPRPRKLLTRRGSTSQRLMPEEGADTAAGPDPIVEKMLKQFGSYVKAFEKEHGIQMMEHVSGAGAAAPFESPHWLLQHLRKATSQRLTAAGHVSRIAYIFLWHAARLLARALQVRPTHSPLAGGRPVPGDHLRVRARHLAGEDCNGGSGC